MKKIGHNQTAPTLEPLGVVIWRWVVALRFRGEDLRLRESPAERGERWKARDFERSDLRRAGSYFTTLCIRLHYCTGIPKVCKITFS